MQLIYMCCVTMLQPIGAGSFGKVVGARVVSKTSKKLVAKVIAVTPTRGGGNIVRSFVEEVHISRELEARYKAKGLLADEASGSFLGGCCGVSVATDVNNGDNLHLVALYPRRAMDAEELFQLVSNHLDLVGNAKASAPACLHCARLCALALMCVVADCASYYGRCKHCMHSCCMPVQTTAHG
jgi:hypothetical protein